MREKRVFHTAKTQNLTQNTHGSHLIFVTQFSKFHHNYINYLQPSENVKKNILLGTLFGPLSHLYKGESLMAKVFFTCFGPFNLREKASIFCNEDLGLFSSLMVDFEVLGKSLEEKPLSLEWCSEAMALIKKMHSCFLLWFEESKVLVSQEGVSALDMYMSVTLGLLDLCNLLKRAISSMNSYRMMVDFTMKGLQEDAFSASASKKAMERLARDEEDKLLEAKKWRNLNMSMSKTKRKISNHASNINVVHTIGSTMTLLSSLIYYSIFHLGPIKFDNDDYSGGFFMLNLVIQKLILRFNERYEREGERVGVGFGLFENEMVKYAINELKVDMRSEELNEGRVMESAEMIKERCVALKGGLDLFECAMNEVFEDVIKGRKRVIGLITAKNFNFDNRY